MIYISKLLGINEFGEGLHSYRLGNHVFGIQLVLRNLADRSSFTRRYIRLIFSLFGTQTILEHRFSNSI